MPAEHPSDRTRLGVVAITYSPGETLRLFLGSLRTAADWSTAGPPVVVLADNGSTDGSVEAVSGDGQVRLLRTGGNLGYGAAANAGLRSLPAEIRWVLVCNPDVMLHPGAIDELLRAAARWPRAAALGPQLHNEDGLPYPSARELPSLGRGAGHALLGWVWPTNPWTKAYRRDHEVATERAAGWLSGACLLLRRDVFETVGGFDERYFMYFEDVDLGERLSRAGYLNVFVPSAIATHLGGHSTQRHKEVMLRAHHDSAYIYLASRYRAWWQAPVRGALWAGLRLRSFGASRSAALARGAAIPDHAKTG